MTSVGEQRAIELSAAPASAILEEAEPARRKPLDGQLPSAVVDSEVYAVRVPSGLCTARRSEASKPPYRIPENPVAYEPPRIH